MPNLLTTSSLVLPTELSEGIFKRAYEGSAVARLAIAKPQKFGTSEAMVLEGTPRAELVGEGAQKSASDVAIAKKVVTPRKLQTTVRVSDEVRWADEDYQLGVLDTVSEAIGDSLARALDLVAIHGINPLTGAVAPSITDAIKTSTLIAERGADAELDIEAAVALLLAKHYKPTGIALDNMFAWGLATERYADGRKKFPEVGMTNELYTFAGIAAATTDAVSGQPEIEVASNIHAIVGNWDMLKWGVQRQVKLRVFDSGDPDGQGDLARNNQIALRAEVVYGIGLLDKNAFALIKTAAG